MKEQKATQQTENSKRISLRCYIKADDSLKMEELIKTLKKRGWKKEKTRLSELIMDELFLNADKQFYEEILSKLTPLEYLFKTKMNNPTLRLEMEKILKRKDDKK